MNSSEFLREGNGWKLPWESLKVTQLRFDYAFTIALDAKWELRIGDPFVITSGSSSIEIDPEGSIDLLHPALVFQRRTVIAARAQDSGAISLLFDGDLSLSVAAGMDFEAWQLVGPEHRRMVSTVGGDLAIWS